MTGPVNVSWIGPRVRRQASPTGARGAGATAALAGAGVEPAGFAEAIGAEAEPAGTAGAEAAGGALLAASGRAAGCFDRGSHAPSAASRASTQRDRRAIPRSSIAKVRPHHEVGQSSA